MKNKTRIFIISSTLIILLLLCTVIIIHNKHYDFTILTLEELMYDNEFQYDKIAWGSSADQVSKNTPYPLEKDHSKEPLPNNTTYYKSKNTYILDSQSAIASLEFYNNELRIVKFDFHLDENYEEWFEKQVTKIIQLYGSESAKMEQESEQFKSIVYKWETADTMLQIILITGDTIKPSATLGVCTK